MRKKLTDHQTTSLNYSAWERLLQEDCEHGDFILNGNKDRFHIIDPHCVSHSVEIDNYTSATAKNVRAHVESQIITEIQSGRYRIVDRKPSIISVLGAIPKKDPNNVHLIHDASKPSGQALKAHIHFIDKKNKDPPPLSLGTYLLLIFSFLNMLLHA